jgi:hypothetical protein
LSPAAGWLRGRPISAGQRAGDYVPYHLTERLLARPAAPRRVFTAPIWWGDYLLWRLPPQDRVYWYAQPEGFDSATRRDAAALAALPSPEEWQALADRYRINTLVVQSAAAPALCDYLRGAGQKEWEILADNTADGTEGGGPESRGVVAVRRTDPFALTLAEADAVQARVGGLGMAPRAGPWSVLSHLPWAWPKPR